MNLHKVFAVKTHDYLDGVSYYVTCESFMLSTDFVTFISNNNIIFCICSEDVKTITECDMIDKTPLFVSVKESG